MGVPLRQKIKSAVVDCPVYEMTLRCPGFMRQAFGRTWIDLGNRNDRFTRSESGPGVKCDWKWTSDLFPCRAFPGLARRLMKAAFDEWPVCFDPPEPSNEEPFRDEPLVSFIIGHRGAERKALLLQTIKSILAQKMAQIECIVVEQATVSVLTDGQLPKEVRHILTPPPEGMPYCRSWAFNVGAHEAKGAFLVLHDNDLCVPDHYANQVVEIMIGSGVSVVQIQRFVFYLSKAHTREITAQNRLNFEHSPERVRQNLQGMTIAVEKNAYFSIGGHDEDFVGWGGEDNEFFERCQTLPHYVYGYLPMIHLWHPWQKDKQAAGRSTAAVYEQKKKVPPSERIRLLTKKSYGRLDGPNSWASATVHS